MHCFKSTKSAILVATQIASIVLPAIWQWGTPSAQALPGQSPSQVIEWVKAHPVLRPQAGELLLVRKSDTPAKRFQFQASVFIPGIAAMRGDPKRIRGERISLFDIVNGVSKARLEQAIRDIYGPEIMRDYANAEKVLAYPTATMIQRSQQKNASPILSALQGELLRGEKYGYWVEVLQNNRGSANSGQITVFELSSLQKLETELNKRMK